MRKTCYKCKSKDLHFKVLGGMLVFKMRNKVQVYEYKCANCKYVGETYK